MNRHHYFAYGLHLACDFELPELVAWLGDADHRPDVWIQLQQALSPAEVEQVAGAGQGLEFGERSSRLLFQVARFTVRDGAQVTVEPVEGHDVASWRVPLLGSVLAVLLEQRGVFALHAGALSFDAGAAAFLGDKGQGKSTLNAALSCAGYALLSDDVVGLQWADATSSAAPLALPGFSQVKLASASLRAVTGQNPAAWPSVAPGLVGLDKRSFQAPLEARARPLRALFVLHSLADDEADEGDEAGKETSGQVASAQPGLRLRRLGAQEALAQLIPHTFGARFGENYLRGERRKAHFLSCARLVSACAVWELSRRRDLNLLPATVALIARAMGQEPA